MLALWFARGRSQNAGRSVSVCSGLPARSRVGRHSRHRARATAAGLLEASQVAPQPYGQPNAPVHALIFGERQCGAPVTCNAGRTPFAPRNRWSDNLRSLEISREKLLRGD